MSVDAVIKQAMSYIQNGQYDEAIVELKKAELTEPDNPFVHLFLFNAYGGNRDNANARRHLLRLKALNPDMAQKIIDEMPDFIRSRMGV